MNVNLNSPFLYTPPNNDESTDKTNHNPNPSPQRRQSTETCRLKDGREVKLEGFLSPDGKFFVAAPVQGEKPVVWEAIEGNGKQIFVEEGTTAKCWVQDTRRKNNRGVWTNLAGEHFGRQFKTKEGHVYSKTEAGYVRGLVAGTEDMVIDETSVAARIRLATEAVNAWVNECLPGTLERSEREDAASMRMQCLGGAKEFRLNHTATITEFRQDFFVGMEHVETLDLQFNPYLSSLEGSGYERLVNLKRLFLNQSTLWSMTVEHFRALEVLEAHFVQDDGYSDHGELENFFLRGLNKLECLHTLIGCANTKIEDIRELSSLKVLIFKDPGRQELANDYDYFYELEKLTKLEVLEIESECLEGIRCFPKLRKLQTSCYGNNKNYALNELNDLSMLEELSLNANLTLNMAGLEELPSLKTLELYFEDMEMEDGRSESENVKIFLERNAGVIKQLRAKNVELKWDREGKFIAPFSLDKELKKSQAQFDAKLKELEAKLTEKITQTGAKLDERVSNLQTATAGVVKRDKKTAAAQEQIWGQMRTIGLDPGKKAYMETVSIALYSMMQRAFGNLPLVEEMGGSSIQSAGVLPLSILSSSSTIAGTVVGEISTAAGAFLGIDPLTKILQAVADAYSEHDFNKKAVGLSRMLGTELDRIFELCHTLARGMALMKAWDLPPGSVPEPARETSLWKKLKKEFTQIKQKVKHQSKKLDGTAGLDAKKTEKQIEACVHAAQILLGIVSGKAFDLERHEVGLHYKLEEMGEKGLEWFCMEQDRGEFQFDAKHIVWGVANKDFKPEKNASTSASTSASASTSQQTAVPLSRSSSPETEKRMTDLINKVMDKLEEQSEINKQLRVEQQHLTTKVIELENTLEQKSRMHNDTINKQTQTIQNLGKRVRELEEEVSDLKKALPLPRKRRMGDETGGGSKFHKGVA